MAFPAVSETVITDNTASLVTVHPMDIPSPLNIGSLLLAFWWTTRDGFASTAIGDWPSGWVEKASADMNNHCGCHSFKYRPPLLPILGVERGERTTHPGGTIFMTTPLGQRSYFICMLIEPDDIPTEYVLGADAISGGPAAPDPPNLVYSGSAKDVLWFAQCVPLGAWSLVSYPTNYTLYQHDVGNLGALAGRELNAASEDPGAFSPFSPSDFGACTVGVAIDGP